MPYQCRPVSDAGASCRRMDESSTVQPRPPSPLMRYLRLCSMAIAASSSHLLHYWSSIARARNPWPEGKAPVLARASISYSVMIKPHSLQHTYRKRVLRICCLGGPAVTRSKPRMLLSFPAKDDNRVAGKLNNIQRSAHCQHWVCLAYS